MACYDLIELNQKIYAAVNINSVCEITRDSLRPIMPAQKRKYPFPAHSINDFFVDHNNTCWFGAWDNFLHRLDPVNDILMHDDFLHKQIISYSEDEIRCITEAQPGKLWIAMKSNQVYEYSIETGHSALVKFTARESGKLHGKRMNFLHTDKLFRTWIGTDNGLHLWDPQSSKFNIISLEDQSAVKDFAEQNGELYLATTGGVYKSSEIKSPVAFNPAVPSLTVYSICSSGPLLFIGTNTTLFKFNTTNKGLSLLTRGKQANMDPANIASSLYNKIRLIDLMGSKIPLASAYGHGIIAFEVSSGKWNLISVYQDDVIENLIQDIFQDSKGRIWILGSNLGVSRLDLVREAITKQVVSAEQFFDPELIDLVFQTTSFNKNLLSKQVTAICEKRDGSFWITTQGAGLFSFNPENANEPFTSIPSPTQSMQNLVMDNEDNLWVSASGGLLNYNPKTNIWLKYDERDGIPPDGLSGSLFKDSRGWICAGGNGFYLHFNPANSMISAEIPTPTITHVFVMDTPSDSLLADSQIRLPDDKNFISIHFSALCFSNPTSIIYEYRLDGLDENWRNNGNDGKVSYSDLSPGNYVFHLRALNPDGTSPTKETLLQFTILSPFYLRWWFFALIILSIAWSVAAFLKYRKNQRLKVDVVRNKIARDLHDEIGSALGSISFFSETGKRTLNENNSEGTNRVLEKIGSTSREMIENMHDIVWAVNPHNDNFSHLTERMKSYVTDVASSNDISLRFLCANELSATSFSMTERKNIFLIFKEAVYNSCKYSKCSSLKVTLEKNSVHKLIMTISDDGIGFDLQKSSSSGNGLRNMKSRAQEINATCEILTKQPGGTSVSIRL